VTKDQESSGGVSIGNVTGGITGAVIAGRDAKVEGSTIAVGKLPELEEEPTVEGLQELLAEIQRALAEIAEQKELLEGIDPTYPVQAQLAEAQVNTAAQAAQAGEKVEAKDAESMKDRLEKASGLLNSILEGAKTAAEKVGDVVEAAAPVAEKLEPLLQSLGVAVAMVAKLWLTS
jgi:hypothetical protein